MAKQLNVSLAFTADTSQAKAQINELQNSLNKIASTPMSSANGLGKTTQEIQQASAAALNLSVHLKNALNQDTGRLDFAKLNQSLKKSGTTLDAYANKIRNLGPEGEQAFLQLARAISTSEVPIRRSNQLMSELWTTMKNTARWQLSSSALHGFMGTMQQAYGYAQSLNRSLNDIRIVTGYGVDEMARFATEANKAAKALSTTTTEYTNASLIYYQQGLTDQQVKERTDITVKMANVSRESAQVVSDQMTAVWNNFDDGSKSLEYYADVMTALGAATASSTAEISAGLEKFAAIAETVGLSYEYATASLATITATTRQSADVVGNALKTLFARIQGLSLGETLEDGVDLNKYSEALAKVGVDVIDANGQMREMDDILDDLAAKWDTIGKAEQTALAQTVAGVRQYTQLVALMDNWDFMEENLQTAYGSAGALQQQADIYAESWEAASDRVRAAAEDIFDSLINDEFFINLLNGFENILTVVGNLIDSLGGMGGAISALGVIFTKVFSTQLQASIENMAYNIKMSTEYGRQAEQDKLFEFFKKDRITDKDTSKNTPISEAFSRESEIYKRFLQEQDGMSEVDREIVQKNIGLLQKADDDIISKTQKHEKSKAPWADVYMEAKGTFSQKEGVDQAELSENLNNLSKETQIYHKEKKALDESFAKGSITIEKYGKELAKIQSALTDAETKVTGGLGITEDEKKILDKFEDASQKVGETEQELTDAKREAEAQAKRTTDAMDNAKKSQDSWSATVINAANSTMQLTMGLNALSNVFDVISNPDLSGWEKFSAILSSLAIGVPALINAWNGFETVLEAIKANLNAETIALGLNSAAQVLNAKSRGENIQAGTQQAIEESVKKRKQQLLDELIDQKTDQLYQAKPFLDKEIVDADGRRYRRHQDKNGNWHYNRKQGNAWQNIDGRFGESKFAEAEANYRKQLREQVSLTDKDKKLVNSKLLKSSIDEIASAFKSFLPILKHFSTIGLAIAGIAGAITLASKAWFAHEDAANKAREAAERATESYQKVSQKAETFKEVVSDWKDAREGLRGLQKGTEEYAEALENANQKAKELIETYGLFGQYDYVNGVIQINDQALKEIQSQYNKEASLAEYNMYSKKNAQLQAEINRDSINFKRENSITAWDVGQDGSAILKSLDSNSVAEIAKIIASSIEPISEEYLKNNLDEKYQNFIPSIMKNIDDLESFGNSLNSATEESEYYSQQMKIAALEYNYGDMFDRIATDELGQVNEELRASVAAAAASLTDFTGAVQATASALTGINWLDWLIGGVAGVWQDGENWEDRYLEYAKLQGYTDQDLKGAYVKGTSVYNAKGEALINDVDRGLVYQATTDYRNNQKILEEALLGEPTVKVVDGEYTYIPTGEGGYAKVPKTVTVYDGATSEEALENKLTGIRDAGAFGGTDFSQIAINALTNDGKFDFSTAYGSLSESEFNNLKSMSGAEIAQLLGYDEATITKNWGDEESLAKAFKTGLGDFDAERFRSSADAEGSSLAEQYGLDKAEFESYRDILYQTNDLLKEQPDLLNKVAIANKRYQKGIDKIADSWDDWNKVIQKGDALELSGIMKELEEATKDILNLDDDVFEKLSPDFAVENWDLITEAMNGSEEAYEQLQAKAAKEIVLGVDYEVDGIDIWEQKISDAIDAVQNDATIEIGTTFDESTTAQSLFSIAARAGKTADEISEMFEGIGWDPEITTETYTLRDEDVSKGFIQVPTSLDPLIIENIPINSNLSSGMTVDYPVINGKSTKKTSGGGSAGYTPTSKGRGGGGGSKKIEKKNDSDKERYHTLTNQLEDLEDAYDDVSKAAERAFGKDKLALMDEQIAKTDDLIDKQQEYVDAIEANLEPDKQAFIGLYDKYIQGPEIQFDASGNISNFDEIQDAMYDLYNKNAESMNEEEWEIFKEHYEQVEKYMEQYEETYDLLREEENKMQDLVNQRIDLLLEKVKYEVELELSISEDSLEVLDFQLKRLNDDAFAVAETLALLGEKAQTAQHQLETNLAGMADTLKASGVSDAEIAGFLDGTLSIESLASQYSFTEEQIQTLRDYKSGALDALQTMQDLRDEAQEKTSAAFDEFNEKLQDAQSTFDHLNSTLESYRNIIDIVGQEMLGVTDELMEKLNDALVENAINQLDSSRRAWEALQTAEETAKMALADAIASGVEDDIKYWEKEVERINKEEEAAQETMLSNWENTLTLIVEEFKKAVEDAVESFNKSFTADGTFLSDAYDKRQKENERYIEDYQKIYELSKLNRDINNSIDDTDNLASKKKLRELLAEINEYEAEGVQMSEYDVEYMQKKYDLYKAQIALEEAQSAKDTVRLTKDNEGNWSYAYTADKSKVEQAEQEYEDALYALQELNYEYLEEMEAAIVDTMDEMSQALAEIKVEDFATTEEYYAEIDRVTQFYTDQILYYQSEMQSSIDRNKELYEEDWEAYNRITGYKISANENFITSWKETMLGQLTESESETVDIYSKVVDSLDVLIAGLLGAYDTMTERVDDANEAAGTSTEGFGETVEEVVDQTIEESEAAGEAVEDMANQMEAGFDTATTALLKWADQYSSTMEKAISDTMGVVDAYNLLIKTLAENKYTSSSSNSSSGGNGSNGSSSSGSSSSGSSSSGSSSSGSSSSGSGNNNNINYSGYFASKEEERRFIAEHQDAINRADRYDTGGYTGDWGDSSGRLALLHQKELVLNQEDTANILSTVKLVRQLTNTIDLNAQAASIGIGLLRAQTIKDEKTSDILQQEVTIHAEFPNVQDQNEIRLAFNDLINTASQYANRK